MSSVTLTSPPTATARLVVDTDVASFVFKWHPEFAPRYVEIIRGSELVPLVHDSGGDAPGCAGCELGAAQLTDFSVLHSDSRLCSTWAAVRNESGRKGRQMSSADAWIAATALVL